jgi:hypothetical protein
MKRASTRPPNDEDQFLSILSFATPREEVGTQVNGCSQISRTNAGSLYSRQDEIGNYS